MYQEGLGGPRDAVIALVWYRKAAAQGSAEGEFNAASLLERGAEGIPPDAEAAAEGYARAAKFGLPLASYRLARMLDEARAARRSDGTAFERYLAAAQGGVAEAQAELDKPATQYRFALLLAPVAAVPWLRKAAAQNHVPAQLALAIALEEGRGTSAYPAEAFQWYLKAAAADEAEAHFRLGNLYDQGIGTPADPVRSRDHYARAVELGHAGRHGENGTARRPGLCAARLWQSVQRPALAAAEGLLPRPLGGALFEILLEVRARRLGDLHRDHQRRACGARRRGPPVTLRISRVEREQVLVGHVRQDATRGAGRDPSRAPRVVK